MKLFIATKAFIEFNGKILILRESSKYLDGTQLNKYGVPGGRVNPGENFIESLKREILEETGLQISVGDPFFADEWRPIVDGLSWQIVGVFFKCTTDSDEVVLSEDHDDFAWIDPGKYLNYDLMKNNYIAFEKYLK